MPYDPDRHHRRSLRLKGYDYSQEGAYFVTVNALNRECLFGDIREGRLTLSVYGKIVESEWQKTPVLRPNIVLDEFIVMPNHFHAILVVERKGVSQYAPTPSNRKLQSPSQTVGAIVRGFKGAVTKKINTLRQTPETPVWQDNYHERIIRDERELSAKREYVADNPLKWEEDDENPDAKP